MVQSYFNTTNMFNMSNMFNMNLCGSNNILSQLFSGTGSAFGNSLFGNNFFGNNFFGGGSSIFTNFNGTPNYAGQAGLYTGLAIAQVGGMALSHTLEQRKANSQEAISNDIDGIQDLIDAELDKLGSDVTESNYKDFKYTDTDEYKEKLEEIEDDAKEIKGKLTDTELTEQENTSETCAKTIKELKAKKSEPGADVAALDKQINDQESIKKDADDAIAAHKKAVDAEKEIEKRKAALEKTAKAKQEKYDAIIDKIADLIDKKANAQKALNDKIVDNADGSSRSRNKELDVTTIKEGHSEFKKGDIQQLVFQFTQQPDGSKEKLQYAQALKNLDGTTFINMANNSQIKVREWAMDYCKKHKTGLA